MSTEGQKPTYIDILQEVSLDLGVRAFGQAVRAYAETLSLEETLKGYVRKDQINQEDATVLREKLRPIEENYSRAKTNWNAAEFIQSVIDKAKTETK